MPRTSTRHSNVNNFRRLLVGFFLLIFVNILWVASSELTKYIFIEQNFNRPFFTTYVKTCMFTLYLIGFMFYRPWRDQCAIRITQIRYDELEHEPSDIEEENSIHATLYLSEPEFELVNLCSDSERSSIASDTIADFDDSPADPIPSSIKPSVRFNRIHEIRRMPDCEAEEAATARLPYEVWMWRRLNELTFQYKHRLTVRNVSKLALSFTFLWFVANLAYQEALNYTSAGMVSVLSSCSSLFTLLLAAIFPSCATDRFTLSKLCLVLLSIFGVVIVTLVDESSGFEQDSVPWGIVWALLGSIGYACYLVLLRRRVDSEDKFDMPMFFGFVGLFAACFLWPIMCLLHSSSLESFYPLPERAQLLCIIVNGLVGTVLSEYLWLWGCFLTSSLLATMSLSLAVPLTLLADAILWEQSYPWMFYLGLTPILFAFIANGLIAYYDVDPVYEGLRILGQQLLHIVHSLCRFCCCRWSIRRQQTAGNVQIDREQAELLVGNDVI